MGNVPLWEISLLMLKSCGSQNRIQSYLFNDDQGFGPEKLYMPEQSSLQTAALLKLRIVFMNLSAGAKQHSSKTFAMEMQANQRLTASLSLRSY